ncbi:MAG: TonB-dependent receptor [Lysobacter sp.]|nr:TonB-dependent receptor [Lysobacter sp.]
MPRSARTTPRRLPARLPLTAAIYFAFGSLAWAQDAAPQQPPPTGDAAQQPAAAGKPAANRKQATLETVTVTAQKRVENVQKVPISMQAISETKLTQQDVHSFDDYVKLLPSVTFGNAGGGVFSGPGFAQVYMRGVASGDNGNHSGPQPSVGMYLDEEPITTIQGALDINVYDVQRIEALAGPQGTLYGASSQAGTIRIITNKPDKTGFAAGYQLEADTVNGGGTGWLAQGFVNAPLSDSAALRVVGWKRRDAGYVDNVPGTRQFPAVSPLNGAPLWGGVLDNTDNCVSSPTRYCSHNARDNYNWADTVGARAALKIDLNDNWSITPTLIGQRQQANGSTGYDPSVGDLKVKHFYPEHSDDKWTQAALTVQGKIGNFDLVYAYAHLKRDVDSQADYNDYGFWYDTLSGYSQYFHDNAGNPINISQHITAKDGYTKSSHELRITSPKEDRLRFVAGVFFQQQGHNIFQRYFMDGLSTAQSVPGWPNTVWLTAQQRTDRDRAVFGEVSFDITKSLTATVGSRWFQNDNSLKGFFGFGDWGWSSQGVASCFSNDQFHGAPCVDLDKEVKETNHIGRANLTWNISNDKMLYATWSEGYRPGGINRRGTIPPYHSDFLTNYEVGWKTTWGDNVLVWNGALFQENWDDFQFSYLGQNGLTEIRNAAQARIRGFETEVRWAATDNLLVTAGGAFYDAKLTQNYCGALSPVTGQAITDCPAGSVVDGIAFPDGPQAAKGTRLPVTPRFKGNVTARYTFDLWGGEAYGQASLVHQGVRRSALRTADNDVLGDLKPYTLTDLSAGFRRDNWSLDFFLKNAFDTRAQLSRFTECAVGTCGAEPYTVVAQPRTIGVRFSQDF